MLLRWLQILAFDLMDNILGFLKNTREPTDGNRFLGWVSQLRTVLKQLLLYNEARTFLEKLYSDELSRKELILNAMSVKMILRPVDFDRLSDLLQQNALRSHEFAGSDIAVLLGSAGVGKSTTVGFLGGVFYKPAVGEVGLNRVMVPVDPDVRCRLTLLPARAQHVVAKLLRGTNFFVCLSFWFLSVWRPTALCSLLALLIASQSVPAVLRAFKTSSGMNATTKSIDAVKLLWDGRSIIICDTPGFVRLRAAEFACLTWPDGGPNDLCCRALGSKCVCKLTRPLASCAMTWCRFHDEEGPETDIANGVGIVRAIQQANSVRPILLLSFLDFGNKAAKSIDDMGACREPGPGIERCCVGGWFGARVPLYGMQ